MKDGEVFAHRIILAARCNAFLEEGSLGFDDDKSFTPPTKFQTLKFTSLEPQVIYLLLQTLYSNKIKLVSFFLFLLILFFTNPQLIILI